MAYTRAQQIVEALRDRLYAIKASDGFNTTPTVLPIGTQPALSEHFETDYVISLFEQPDQPADEQTCGDAIVSLQVVIEGAAKFCDLDEYATLNMLWQDIAKAVFLSDASIGGLALAITRGPKGFVYSQAGEGITGIRQVVNVQYLETYGNP